MGDRRKIEVLFRRVSKFLPMTESKHLASIERLTMFRGHDDLGNVVGVAVYRDTSLEHLKR